MCCTQLKLRTITIRAPALENIQGQPLAINSADDLINPPELGILEREIKRVPHGRAIVIPLAIRRANTEVTLLRHYGRASWRH